MPRPSNKIVQFCYHLEESSRYARLKGFFYDLLENPNSLRRRYFDLFMVALVLSSVSVIIFEMKRGMRPAALAFETFAVSIFVIEYLLRLWLYSSSHKIIIEQYEQAELTGRRFHLLTALWLILRQKLEYATTPLAVIDLLAILPSYRPLRFLRLFLLFRLFKLFRYVRPINEFARILAEKRFDLLTLAGFVGFLSITASTAIYFFEAGINPKIEGFFDALYWSVVTISTVGYGDITPASTEGRVITIMLIFSGIGVLSFATSIIVSAFAEKLRDLREDRVFSEVERRRHYTIVCGYGRIGTSIAAQLCREKEHVVIVDPDPERVDRAKRGGLLAVQGNAAEGDLLNNLGIDRHARRILCLTGDDVTNVYITLLARQASTSIQIISRANHHESRKKLERAGADYVVSPYESVGLIGTLAVGQPVAFEAMQGIMAGHKDIDLEAIPVLPGSPLDGHPLADTALHRRNLILFGVIRAPDSGYPTKHPFYDLDSAHFFFNPVAEFHLHANDLLVVFGHQKNLTHFKHHPLDPAP